MKTLLFDKMFGPETVEGEQIILAYVVRIIMKFFFIWSNGKRDFWFYIKFAAFYVHMWTCLAGVVGSLYYYISNYGVIFEPTADAASGILLCAWSSGTTMYFSSKQREYERLLDELADFSEYEKPDGIEKLNKTINKSSVIVFICMWSCIILAFAFNWFVHCEDYVEDSCGMLVTSWFPVKEFFTRWNRRWALSLQVSVVLFVCGPSFFGPCCMITVCELIVNRIDHLINMIREIPKMETRKNRKVQVAKCVHYHQKILEFADRLTENSYIFMLIHVPYTTFMLTLITIQLITKIRFLDIANLGFWLFYIFLCCIFGERLLSKSVAIGDACYKNEPFGEDVTTQKELLFMILANRELCITAGMNEQCNHEKLVEVLKTSYSFITLLGSLGGLEQ